MRFTPKTFLRYAAEEQGIEPLYYDGCEMGEYEKGNVNIFDNI